MQLIDDETNIEVLKVWSKHLLQKVDHLEAYVKQLEKKQAEENQIKLHLNVELVKLKNLLFATGRETNTAHDSKQSVSPTHPILDRVRQKQSHELLLHSQSLVGPPQDKQCRALEMRVVMHEVTSEQVQSACLELGIGYDPQQWEDIKGLTDKSTQVTVIERRYIKEIHQRKKKRYIPSKDASLYEKEIILTADGQDKLLPGSGYSIDFALSVVADKYEFHLPLERQRRKMEGAGLTGVGTKTLYNLCFTVASYLETVVPAIQRDIFNADLAVHADETTWPILGKNDDDGYLWSLSNQAGAYYCFEPTRSGAVVEEALAGYQGVVLSDGYTGYHRLKAIKGLEVAHCWSHVRRKFYEIREFYPQEVATLLTLIDGLFAIERKAEDWHALQKLRDTESRKLTHHILQWLLEQESRHLEQSALCKAIRYTLKLWTGLTLFLSQPRVPLSNNDAERALRHAVIGRKNFNGSKTIDGADTAATLYTIIESCKRVEIQPTTYMKYVITTCLAGDSPLSPLAYARKIRQP